MKPLQITLLGSGNVASHLGPALYRAGCKINQVYSPNLNHAELLSSKIDASPVSFPGHIDLESDVFLFMLKDEAVLPLASSLQLGGKLLINTSGNSLINLLENSSNRRAIIYPLQTFSKLVPMDLGNISFFIESAIDQDLNILRALSAAFSEKIYLADSALRQQIHLAGVIAANFSNHMYAIASRLLSENGMPFSILDELIKQTVGKALVTNPESAQTGPASRYDQQVLDSQLKLLSAHPEWRQLYHLISQDIQRLSEEQSTLPPLQLHSLTGE